MITLTVQGFERTNGNTCKKSGTSWKLPDNMSVFFITKDNSILILGSFLNFRFVKTLGVFWPRIILSLFTQYYKKAYAWKGICRNIFLRCVNLFPKLLSKIAWYSDSYFSQREFKHIKTNFSKAQILLLEFLVYRPVVLYFLTNLVTEPVRTLWS